MNVILKKLAVFFPFSLHSSQQSLVLRYMESVVAVLWKPFEYKSVKDMNTWIIRIAGGLTN